MMPKPHVILIAYHFPPGPEMGAVRPYRFYKYLERMGYRLPRDHRVSADRNQSRRDVHPDDLREIWDGAGEQRINRSRHIRNCWSARLLSRDTSGSCGRSRRPRVVIDW